MENDRIIGLGDQVVVKPEDDAIKDESVSEEGGEKTKKKKADHEGDDAAREFIIGQRFDV